MMTRNRGMNGRLPEAGEAAEEVTHEICGAGQRRRTCGITCAGAGVARGRCSTASGRRDEPAARAGLAMRRGQLNRCPALHLRRAQPRSPAAALAMAGGADEGSCVPAARTGLAGGDGWGARAGDGKT